MRTGVLYCAILLAALGSQADQLSKDASELLGVIASRNRANMEMVTGIDLEYQFALTTDKEKPVVKNGRFAMESGRTYLHEQVADSKVEWTYVKNGGLARTAQAGNPRLVMIGKPSNDRMRAFTPSPWELCCPVSLTIDQLDPKIGLVTSVREERVDEKRYVVVHFSRKETQPGTTQYTCEYDVWHSRDDGYLPLRTTMTMKDDAGGVVMSGEARIDEVFKIDMGGQTAYVPVAFVETSASGPKGAIGRKVTYRIDPKTIKVNPRLPDSLFELPIRSTDQVINADIDYELNNPWGKQLMAVESEAGSMTAPAIAGSETAGEKGTIGSESESQAVAQTKQKSGESSRGHWMSWVGGSVLAICACGVLWVLKRRGEKGRRG